MKNRYKLKNRFILLLLLFPIFLFSEEDHRIYFQSGWGYGTVKNANDEITKKYYTQDGIAYAGLNQGNYIPIQTNENKERSVYPRRPRYIPSQNNLEYRYKNRFRLYLEHRIFNTKSYESDFVYLPSKDVSNGLISKKNYFQEERYKLGGAYFIPLFDFLNIGILGNYYAIGQLSSYTKNVEINPKFSSFLYGQKKEYFYGFVPGISLELKIKSSIEILYSFEYVQLNSDGSNTNSLYMFPVIFYKNKISNTILGNFNKLVFIYRPVQWFGIHLGLVRETYQKRYGKDTYIGTNSATFLNSYVTDNLISNFILQTNHFHQALNYAYLQFEVSKGF